MDFVNILTIFTDDESRNIESLKKCYSDVSKLKVLIEKVTNGFLLNENIYGKRILIKPNWVLDNRRENDDLCLRTNDNFTLAVLDLILEKNPKSILIGDAPIQGCHWNKMITNEFIVKVDELSKKYGIEVKIKDFRRVTFDPTLNNPNKERNPISEYVIFNLGKKSKLEPISYSKKNLFRVTDYHPDRLSESHGPGIHKYCITKELFDNDVVITLPKIKTHQKTGLTNSLKILVGINGDKDYLPHHRKGGTDEGGDCYPGKNVLLKWAELALDTANRTQGKRIYRIWRKLVQVLWRLSLPTKEQNLAAGWYGNDTTWRMVMDINTIAVYGNIDGVIAKKPQRVIYSLCDGIIGGQGDGPLKPDPLALGVICFSNNAEITDVAIGYLMRFDISKIPILKFANKRIKKESKIFLNGKISSYEQLKSFSISTIPAPGWVNFLMANEY